MTKAMIKGDKFERIITEMETGEATRKHLESRGFEGQLYMATRDCKRGGGVFAGLVYKVKATGKYVFAK